MTPDHYESSDEQFLKDASRHELIIHQEQGLYRHLAFARPDNSAYYFYLPTWPGYLAITGEM